MSADRVDAAMADVDRRSFLPRSERRYAGQDRPLPIGLGQTNSQPRTVAAMLRLLEVTPGDRILDVGAGSGWTTALLSRLTGADGSVLGVELEPRLATWGAANLAAAGVDNATVVLARPGVLGWPDDAPYDRILVSAAATELPESLVEQLGDDAVMVCVVGWTMQRIVRRHGGPPEVSRHGSYSFVPLRTHPFSH